MVLHSRAVTRDLSPQKLRSGRFSSSFRADGIPNPECSFPTVEDFCFLYFSSAVPTNFCKRWGRKMHFQLPEDHRITLVSCRGFGFDPSTPEFALV